MKRQDVVIGVEYAATAPLAYGREPRENRPRRVRFTDTRPGPWLRVIVSEYQEHGSRMTSGAAGWNTVETKILSARSADGIKALDELPHDFRAALLDKYGVDEPYERKRIGGSVEPAVRRVLPPGAYRYGDRVTYVDDSLKGGLPGEVWRGGQWVTTLVQPADIHRTWDEVQAKDARRAAHETELDARAKVSEVNALLALVGLSDTIRARRIGQGARLDLASPPGGGHDGERLLADLTEWAESKGLIARIEV